HCNGAAGRRRLPWALALLAALSVLAVVLRAVAALALPTPFLFPDEGAYALLGRGLWGATGVDARRGADARAVFARLRRHDRRGGDLPTARRARLVARGPRARLAVAPQPAAARRHARRRRLTRGEANTLVLALIGAAAVTRHLRALWPTWVAVDRSAPRGSRSAAARLSGRSVRPDPAATPSIASVAARAGLPAMPLGRPATRAAAPPNPPPRPPRHPPC